VAAAAAGVRLLIPGIVIMGRPASPSRVRLCWSLKSHNLSFDGKFGILEQKTQPACKYDGKVYALLRGAKLCTFWTMSGQIMVRSFKIEIVLKMLLFIVCPDYVTTKH